MYTLAPLTTKVCKREKNQDQKRQLCDDHYLCDHQPNPTTAASDYRNQMRDIKELGTLQVRVVYFRHRFGSSAYQSLPIPMYKKAAQLRVIRI